MTMMHLRIMLYIRTQLDAPGIGKRIHNWPHWRHLERPHRRHSDSLPFYRWLLARWNRMLSELWPYRVQEIGHEQLTLEVLSTLWSFSRSSFAALTSSFLAAMWSAGRWTFPPESFSRRTATTLSWPCCRATASGVNPSWKGTHVDYLIELEGHK